MEELEYSFDDFLSEIILTRLNEINELLGDFDGYFGQYKIKSSEKEFVIEEFGSTIHLDVGQQVFTCMGITPEIVMDKINYIVSKYIKK